MTFRAHGLPPRAIILSLPATPTLFHRGFGGGRTFKRLTEEEDLRGFFSKTLREILKMQLSNRQLDKWIQDNPQFAKTINFKLKDINECRRDLADLSQKLKDVRDKNLPEALGYKELVKETSENLDAKQRDLEETLAA